MVSRGAHDVHGLFLQARTKHASVAAMDTLVQPFTPRQPAQGRARGNTLKLLQGSQMLAANATYRGCVSTMHATPHATDQHR